MNVLFLELIIVGTSLCIWRWQQGVFVVNIIDLRVDWERVGAGYETLSTLLLFSTLGTGAFTP